MNRREIASHVIDFPLSHDSRVAIELALLQLEVLTKDLLSVLFYFFVSSRCCQFLWRRARLSVFRDSRRDLGTVEGQGPLFLPTCIELTSVDLYSAFVPSEKNPLVDILLSRTISGESPSKPATKSPHRHRSRSISPSKAKRNNKASLGKPQESSLKVKNTRSNTNAEAEEGLLSGNAVAGVLSLLVLGVLGRSLCRSLD